MPNLSFVLAYVESPSKSAELYGRLLGLKPVEASPTFVMFALPNGLMLGLWARIEVEPSASRPGGVELAFAVDDAAAVHTTLAAEGAGSRRPPAPDEDGLRPDLYRHRPGWPSPAGLHSERGGRSLAARTGFSTRRRLTRTARRSG
jgi:catechol 2,3-dioxygenase-like lactoylglutathione lyase family enzyme